jgi:hypothetical protein
VVELLLDETTTCDSLETFHARLGKSGLATELRDQAESSLRAWDDHQVRVVSSTDLAFCPAGTLDPFAPIGKCSRPACAGQMAQRFASSIGLYADRVVLAEPLTLKLSRLDEVTEKTSREIYSQVLVLRVLEPLVAAGVIRFVARATRLCPKCGAHMEKTVDEGIELVQRELCQSLTYNVLNAGQHPLVGVSFDSTRSGRLISAHEASPEVIKQLKATKRNEFVRPNADELGVLEPFLRRDARRYVDTIIVRSAIAKKSNAIVGVDDGLESRCVSALFTERKPTESPTEELAGIQSLDLPWIRDLTPTEIVRLRDEARDALPRFRKLST